MVAGVERQGSAPSLTLVEHERETVLRLTGDWSIAFGPPPDEPVRSHLESLAAGARIRIDTGDLGDWDSVLPSFVLRVHEMAEARGVELDTQSLPEGAVRLVRLATAVPPRTRERTDPPAPLLDRIGKATLAWRDGAEDAVIFLGETTIAFWRLLTGRANVRGQDFWLARAAGRGRTRCRSSA